MSEPSACREHRGDIEAVSAAEVRDVAQVSVKRGILLPRYEANDLIVDDVSAENDRGAFAEAAPFVLAPAKWCGGQIFRVFDDLPRKGIGAGSGANTDQQ